MYPLFWKDLDTDHPRNIFLNSLPSEIAKKYVVTHIIWINPWRKIITNLKLLYKLINSNKTYVLENNIKLKDILSLFTLIRIHLSPIQRKNDRNIFLLDGINITCIIYDEIFRSLSSPSYFEAFLIDKALQKAKLDNLKFLIFRLEYQPHERSILYNTRIRSNL